MSGVSERQGVVKSLPCLSSANRRCAFSAYSTHQSGVVRSKGDMAWRDLHQPIPTPAILALQPSVVAFPARLPGYVQALRNEDAPIPMREPASEFPEYSPSRLSEHVGLTITVMLGRWGKLPGHAKAGEKVRQGRRDRRLRVDWHYSRSSVARDRTPANFP